MTVAATVDVTRLQADLLDWLPAAEQMIEQLAATGDLSLDAAMAAATGRLREYEAAVEKLWAAGEQEP